MVSKSLIARILLFSSLVTGCAHQGVYISPTVPDGASLQITQPFADLRNGGKLYFQAGNQIMKGQLDRWTPFCELYVFNRNRQADYRTSIFPGQFDVGASIFKQEYVDNRVPGSFQNVQLASRFWGGDGLPSYILYSTTMQLYSAQQPDVKSLTCSQKAGTYGDFHLTLGQIRQALGRLIDLKV